MQKEQMLKFYEDNMYGVRRTGEQVTYELLGKDPAAENRKPGPRNPFEVVGGDLVKIQVAVTSGRDDDSGNAVSGEKRETEFIVHAYLPDRDKAAKYPNGSPFIICMHPIMPKDYALEQGYAMFVLEGTKIASDDIEHKGAFYDLYPYGKTGDEQTGALAAWGWGASKVLDAVYNGLGKEFNLDPDASMVTGVSRWGKATAVCGAYDERFRMVIPVCSGAGGLALYNFLSEGKIYDLRKADGPAEYTYGMNEPLSCLQSDSERGWFNDKFLEFKKPSDIPYDQEWLPILACSKDRYYFVIASYMGEDWVNAPSMWECCKKAKTVYENEGLGDHFAIHFHSQGHAVIQEDMELIVAYFNHMYYGMNTGIDMEALKTTLFEGQEDGNAEVLRLRPYKHRDSELIASWLKDEDIFWKWGGDRFDGFPVSAEDIDRKYSEMNGDCEEYDNFYPLMAYGKDGPVGHFIIRYINGNPEVLRFGWVVVDDSKRGRGYGKRMLQLGLDYAFKILKAKKVTIGVYENNAAAFGCYKSLGFKEAPDKAPVIHNIKGREWKVIELEYELGIKSPF